MLKRKNTIFDTPLTIFFEDVYLCTEYGEMLTGRYKSQRKIKNIFKMMKQEDIRFIKSNMSFPGLRPLIISDTSEGIAIFDLSLCPRFGLLIVIFPHFERKEIWALLNTDLSESATLNDGMKIEVERCAYHPIGENVLAFKDRLLEVRRSGEYFTYLIKSNSHAVEIMLDVCESLSRFYGCEIDVKLDSICDNFESKNAFCFESFAFSLVSLIFLARNYSASRSATVKIHIDDWGFYYDFAFRMAKQYSGEQLSAVAPELKHLMSKAENRIFNCIVYQKEDVFVLRAFPWLRTPDSADLKARFEDFIYDC